MDNKLAIPDPTKAMLAYKECLTPAKCISSNAPALAEIRKENGEDKTIKLIQLWISDLNDFLNVSRKMNARQIEQTAILILGRFFYFKMTDINLVFTRAKQGYFGKLYESMDGSKVFSWFEEYDLERCQVSYNKALQEHDTIKSRNQEVR